VVSTPLHIKKNVAEHEEKRLLGPEKKKREYAHPRGRKRTSSKTVVGPAKRGGAAALKKGESPYHRRARARVDNRGVEPKKKGKGPKMKKRGIRRHEKMSLTGERNQVAERESSPRGEKNPARSVML